VRTTLETDWPFVQVFDEKNLFVEWRLELLVDLDLIACDELVGFVGHADHRLQFVEHGIRMPLLRAEAVCDAMQYEQLLVTLTAT